MIVEANRLDALLYFTLFSSDTIELSIFSNDLYLSTLQYFFRSNLYRSDVLNTRDDLITIP